MNPSRGIRMHRKAVINGIEAYHIQVYFKPGDREEFVKVQALWREVKKLNVDGIIDNEVKLTMINCI